MSSRTGRIVWEGAPTALITTLRSSPRTGSHGDEVMMHFVESARVAISSGRFTRCLAIALSWCTANRTLNFAQGEIGLSQSSSLFL